MNVCGQWQKNECRPRPLQERGWHRVVVSNGVVCGLGGLEERPGMQPALSQAFGGRCAGANACLLRLRVWRRARDAMGWEADGQPSPRPPHTDCLTPHRETLRGGTSHCSACASFHTDMYHGARSIIHLHAHGTAIAMPSSCLQHMTVNRAYTHGLDLLLTVLPRPSPCPNPAPVHNGR